MENKQEIIYGSDIQDGIDDFELCKKIADAYNVTNEIGLTPRELLSEFKEAQLQNGLQEIELRNRLNLFNQCEKALDERDVQYEELLSQRDELVEVLKPFAELAKHFNGTVGMRPIEGTIQAWSDRSGDSEFTVEMLKNAYNLLTKINTEP